MLEVPTLVGMSGAASVQEEEGMGVAHRMLGADRCTLGHLSAWLQGLQKLASQALKYSHLVAVFYRLTPGSHHGI
jgi:hypothetical protein